LAYWNKEKNNYKTIRSNSLTTGHLQIGVISW